MTFIIERFREDAKRAERNEAAFEERDEAAFEEIEKRAKDMGIPVERDGALVIVKDSDHFPIGMVKGGKAIMLKVEVLGEREA